MAVNARAPGAIAEAARKHGLPMIHLDKRHKLSGEFEALYTALAGETERLPARVAQLYDRFETQLKQVLREAEMREGLRPTLPVNTAANLLLAAAEGRISQFVRSGFQRSPTENWPDQWQQLSSGFFREAVTATSPSQVSFSG